MRFRLAQRSTTNLLEFHAISQIWEATTAKRMKVDPHYSNIVVH